MASTRDDFAQMIGFNEHHHVIRQQSISSVSSNKISESEMRIQSEHKNEEEDKGVQMEESSKGKVKGSVSLQYFLAGGNWIVLILLIMLLLFVQILASGSDYWVSIW